MVRAVGKRFARRNNPAVLSRGNTAYVRLPNTTGRINVSRGNIKKKKLFTRPHSRPRRCPGARVFLSFGAPASVEGFRVPNSTDRRPRAQTNYYKMTSPRYRYSDVVIVSRPTSVFQLSVPLPSSPCARTGLNYIFATE